MSLSLPHWPRLALTQTGKGTMTQDHLMTSDITNDLTSFSRRNASGTSLASSFLSPAVLVAWYALY